MLPVRLQIQGPQAKCSRRHHVAGFLTLLALSSFVAYFQNIGNFLVTKYTSPLTLQARRQTRAALFACSPSLACIQSLCIWAVPASCHQHVLLAASGSVSNCCGGPLSLLYCFCYS